ncbi:hypothetical protein RND81_06G165200 [Saponaria officinalis]|uniref:Wall-associated receptor kinase galacturonan-binding domain-containing protein n=1 Tax=Saponaria officinalis TaxID=3572 RepID=A0AAW1KCF8_SAPOF
MGYYHVIVVVVSLLAYVTETAPQIAKPGCRSTCENVSIPYPFGIGPKCYHNPLFDVECTDDNKFKLKGLNVSANLQGIPDYIHPVGRQINWVSQRTLVMEFDCQGYCADINNPTWTEPVYSTDLRQSPFLYSSNQNVMLVTGCGGDVVLKKKSKRGVSRVRTSVQKYV